MASPRRATAGWKSSSAEGWICCSLRREGAGPFLRGPGSLPLPGTDSTLRAAARSDPPHDEHGKVIRRLGAGGESAQVGGQGAQHRGCRALFVAETAQESLQPAAPITLPLRLLRVGDAVGHHAYQFARSQPMRDTLI